MSRTGLPSPDTAGFSSEDQDPRLADWDRLADWLRERGIGPDEDSRVEVLAGGTQNILIRYSHAGRDLVLRRPPLHLRKSSNSVLLREIEILRALNGTDVPHAGLVAACTDDNVTGWVFYVMDMVDGFNPAVVVPPRFADSRDLRRDLAFHAMDVLATMGNLDHRSVGLEEFGKPEGFLERQVPRWLRELESFSALDGYEGVELPGLDRIVTWLGENRPAFFRPGIMHGDYHLANLIFSEDDARVLAVVDWEMATIGDPLLDLGRFLATWPSAEEPIGTAGPIYRTEGLPLADELVNRYRATSTLDVSAVDWYIVLACFKIGVILEGTHARSCAGLADPAVGARLHRMSQALFRRAERIVS
ncbi:phosphotransferase family protein [Rhodococcus rhodochrous]|uniref:Phosphotransferase family protein n=1 Tax=Rhodococcus rhodochrous TaxID=1829 RepID=A0AAW4XLG2_RHORH|nr:phosphotransferase family protein [Rhodococcus rhodochrous]MCD2113515.1 phosphotransferase family protein [Rhodococcus rhodochrous]